MKLFHLAIATLSAVLLGVCASYAGAFEAVTFTSSLTSDAAMAMGALLPANPKIRGILSVRAQTPDVKAAIDGVNRAFEEFKAEHTKEISDIKCISFDFI